MAMEQILAYIETHLDEPMTNRQLAELVGYSEYHFLRLFKEYTNMTCKHYISKRRLIRAAQDLRKLEQVYQFSCRAYAGKKRYSGEEYVTHALNVSIILSEMGADANVVLAGMLCDAHAKGCMKAEEAKKLLPAETFRIVSDLTVEKMDLSNSPEEVVQVKLAERLHNMRTIDYIDEAKKREKAEETVEIFMPLARKMNHVKLVDELHALAVRWSR